MIIAVKPNYTTRIQPNYNQPTSQISCLDKLEFDKVAFTSKPASIEVPLSLMANLIPSLFKYIEDLMPSGVHELSTIVQGKRVTLFTKMSKQTEGADYRITEGLANGTTRIFDVFFEQAIIKASGKVTPDEVNNDLVSNLFQIAAEHTPTDFWSKPPVLH